MSDEEKTKEIKILLIEDNKDDVQLIQEMLISAMHNSFKLESNSHLEDGLDRLAEEKFDVVLLDLSLSESQGVDTFFSVYSRAPKVPIIVITGCEDELSAIKAARMGAEDYLIKGKIDSNILAHSIRYAIERKRIMIELAQIRRHDHEKLHTMPIIDELTGLYNRRGFIILFNQQRNLANRNMKGMLLFFIELSSMQETNVSQGRYEQGKILVKAAEIIKATFRKSDIIARLEENKFAALAIEAQKDSAKILISRLQENMKSYDLKNNQPCKLCFNIGLSYYDPENPASIDVLLVRAEESLHKKKKKLFITPTQM